MQRGHTSPAITWAIGMTRTCSRLCQTRDGSPCLTADTRQSRSRRRIVLQGIRKAFARLRDRHAGAARLNPETIGRALHRWRFRVVRRTAHRKRPLQHQARSQRRAARGNPDPVGAALCWARTVERRARGLKTRPASGAPRAARQSESPAPTARFTRATRVFRIQGPATLCHVGLDQRDRLG
jgi:hypothetical protein